MPFRDLLTKEMHVHLWKDLSMDGLFQTSCDKNLICSCVSTFQQDSVLGLFPLGLAPCYYYHFGWIGLSSFDRQPVPNERDRRQFKLEFFCQESQVLNAPLFEQVSVMFNTLLFFCIVTPIDTLFYIIRNANHPMQATCRNCVVTSGTLPVPRQFQMACSYSEPF